MPRSMIKLGGNWQKRLALLQQWKRKTGGAPIPETDLDRLVPPVPCARTRNRLKKKREGFTLIELLVVIAIILIVSVLAIPPALSALSHRQVGEAARQLQGALAGARDQAMHTGSPAGIRLIPDPAFPLIYLPTGQIDPAQPLAYSRWVPIEPAPQYSTGRVWVPDPASLPAAPWLTIAEQIVGSTLNESTAWAWNIRVGDQLQINGSGIWYTVVGPVMQSNPEGFINYGPPGTVSPYGPITQGGAQVYPEFLWLCNGIDDNTDGWIDSGYDGQDNNGNGIIDDPGLIDPTGQTPGEWEQEAWPTGLGRPADSKYTIRRRPAPSSSAREQQLPTNVVIDATTWSTSAPLRSRLPVDPTTGAVEILVWPTGQIVPTTRYGVPSSVGMAAAFLHFWISERADVLPVPVEPAGEWALVTVTSRTGRIATVSNPPVADPFSAAQQGVR